MHANKQIVHNILKTIYILALQVTEYHNIYWEYVHLYCFIHNFNYCKGFIFASIFFFRLYRWTMYSMDIIEEYVHNFQLSNNLVGLQ